jgi:hypothetical protein
MAKGINQSFSRLCGRCEQLVRASDDQVRACLYGNSAIWHWSCWLLLIHERDRLTVRELARELNCAAIAEAQRQ